MIMVLHPFVNLPQFGWLDVDVIQFPRGGQMSFVPAFLFIKVVSRIVPPAVVGLMNLGLDMSVNACHDFQ